MSVIAATSHAPEHGYNDWAVTQFANLIEALDAAPGDRLFITAWIDEDEQEALTFSAFRQAARRQARELRQHGVAAGDRVVIIMPQSVSAMTTFVGAMMLGTVPAFLAYPNFKVEPTKYRSGLAGVTANLGAKVVVIDEEFPDDLLGHVSLGLETTVVRAGRRPPSSTGGNSANESDPAAEQCGAPSSTSGLAFIQHSAGTTGLQKGVALTHAAVLRQIGYLQQALKIDGGSDCIYSWLPLYHDMGLIACFMLPMVCHVPVVMQSPLDWVMHPDTMLGIITQHKCTLAWLPNFAFQFVPRRVPENWRSECDLSSVRALINCSEPVRASSMMEFQKAFAGAGLKAEALQSSYAMAEDVFAVTQSDVEAGPAKVWLDGASFRGAHRVVPVSSKTPGALPFVSSGRLLPNHGIRIVAESGAPDAADEVGEILVKSDCLFEGYYNRPDLTESAIIDGWYHTGDLGFYLDGELYVVGRKKDLLIIGGENIYPQDIEEIASGHPAIHDGRVIAMGVYNPELGTEEIVLVAEVGHGESLAGADEIEREIREKVVAGLGVAVRTILLKPPKWIVKSTAGKPARAATQEKLFREHPEWRSD
jgi:acyl-CoA synthetase (AMP-forming)/AMP-acid ligase II